MVTLTLRIVSLNAARLCALLASVAALAEPATTPRRYDGHQLIRVEVQSAAELDALLQIAEDVWTHNPGPGPVDVRIAPAELAALVQSGLHYAVLIPDVQALIDEEQAATALDGGPFERFLTAAEIDAFTAALAAERPDLVERFIAGRTFEGRDIWALRITGPGGGERTGFLYYAGVHAREWAVMPTVLYFAERLVRDYDTAAEVRDLLGRAEFFLIPLLNPDGYVYSWTTDRFWRKNRADDGLPATAGCVGVDGNRNFGFQWGITGSSAQACSDTFRGAAPWSESESRAVRDLVTANPHIVAFVDIHSYGQYVLRPWGHTIQPLPPVDLAEYDYVGRQLSRVFQETAGYGYAYGQTFTTLYPVSGGSLDWAYGERGLLAFTFELRDVLWGFLLPPNQILDACRETDAALRWLTNYFVYPDAEVRLLGPAGGASYAWGARVPIELSFAPARQVLFTTLRLSTDGGATFPTVIASVPGPLTRFEWTVPAVQSAQCRIRAEIDYDEGPPSSDDSARDFTIFRPDMRVLVPNGGEEWTWGVFAAVRWELNPARPIRRTELRLSTDGGATFPIELGVFGGGVDRYVFEVPALISSSRTRVLARFEYEDGTTSEDQSDRDFVIAGPRARLTAPNGGETLFAGATVEITWSAPPSRTPERVTLRLSTDGGESYPTLIADLTRPASPHATWTVPVIEAALARIRAEFVYADGGSSTDDSDGPFSISIAEALLTAPRPDELVYPGIVYDVRWTAPAARPLQRIVLDLSTDGGARFITPVADILGNPDRYAWLVPFRPSEQARLRATFHYRDGSRSINVSPANFTIHGGAPQALRRFVLDASPGWTTEGQWQFGRPLGGGGQQHGFPDPLGGNPGDNVYGVNLAGDYPRIATPWLYLTTGPITLNGERGLLVRYQRRLNTDYPPFADASFEASTNGRDWVRLWSVDEAPVTDAQWTAVTHSLAPLGDRLETVHLRWGYRTTPQAWSYSGWNIDEIELLGPGAPAPAGDVNCDERTDFLDIAAFILALRGRATYEAQHPACDFFRADVNGDGLVNVADIDAFVAALVAAARI